MYRIFLSHSRHNDFEALSLRDWQAAEVWEDVFLDVDPERWDRGRRAMGAPAARRQSMRGRVVFRVSANWLAPGWCTKEYTTAHRLNKKLFALLIDPSKALADLPPELAGTWQVTNRAGVPGHAIVPGRVPRLA